MHENSHRYHAVVIFNVNLNVKSVVAGLKKIFSIIIVYWYLCHKSYIKQLRVWETWAFLSFLDGLWALGCVCLVLCHRQGLPDLFSPFLILTQGREEDCFCGVSDCWTGQQSSGCHRTRGWTLVSSLKWLYGIFIQIPSENLSKCVTAEGSSFFSVSPTLLMESAWQLASSTHHVMRWIRITS